MNGGRQPAERGCPSHSSLVSSIEKDLQDIMDSLVLEDPVSPGGKKPPACGRSPFSPVVNGGGRCLLSPPASPGAISGGSSYENASPPFSPLSSPASSGGYTSPSPSSQEQGPAMPPLVPLRSSSYNHAVQPPPQCPPPPPGGGPSEPWPAERLGDHRAGSPQLTPKAVPRPRAALQERPPSPFREPRDPLGPSRQPASRAVPEARLQPPESPRAARRNLESMRELPPLSPSLSRRAASPRAAPDAPSPQPRLGREVPGSPRARRKGSEEPRGAGSPSPPLPTDTPPRRPSFSACLSPVYGLGSPAVPSPRQSPRAPRKPLGDPRPPTGPRERKNSITEISDNEDELLEYHRRQRQERVREQEMERLVRHPGPGGHAGPCASVGHPLCKCLSAFVALKSPCLLGICCSCQAAGLSGGITAKSGCRCAAALRAARSPRLAAARGSLRGRHSSAGLPAETAVPSALQNCPRLVQPQQGRVCW